MISRDSFIKKFFIALGGFAVGSAVTIITVYVILWYGFFAYPVPWKVTDPSNPRFDMKDFKFTDYSQEQQLEDALDIIFPPGTLKSKVESVLVTKLRAQKVDLKRAKTPLPEPTDQIYMYTYEHLRSTVFAILSLMPDTEFAWKVNIIYDENKALKDIYVI